MSYEIACIIQRETDNAVLIKDPADDEEHWIPYSQIEMIKRLEGMQAIVRMSDWIAEKKGLL